MHVCTSAVCGSQWLWPFWAVDICHPVLPDPALTLALPHQGSLMSQAGCGSFLKKTRCKSRGKKHFTPDPSVTCAELAAQEHTWSQCFAKVKRCRNFIVFRSFSALVPMEVIGAFASSFTPWPSLRVAGGSCVLCIQLLTSGAHCCFCGSSVVWRGLEAHESISGIFNGVIALQDINSLLMPLLQPHPTALVLCAA